MLGAQVQQPFCISLGKLLEWILGFQVLDFQIDCHYQQMDNVELAIKTSRVDVDWNSCRQDCFDFLQFVGVSCHKNWAD
jgi:hypothetical protein